jgi:hypothetical protein
MLLRNTLYTCSFSAWLALAAFGASPQQATVYASGLSFPSKVISIGSGTLLVTETGTTPNSGRVSLILSGGQRQALLDGLPSGLAAPDGDADGPNGLALQDPTTLYVANGEGDTFVNGPRPGTVIPNPNGPSSPIFATVLKVTFSTAVTSLTSGFTLQPSDHFTLLDGNTVSLTNSSGNTASVQLLAQFRPTIPDPVHIYRNSHPYGLALHPSQPNYLYVADAGMNIVRQVDLASGQTKTLVRFPNTPNPGKVPPVIEAVPTSVHPYGEGLLVSLLSGVPFLPGESRIMSVDPATGIASPFMWFLTSTTDVAVMPSSGPRPIFFSLEYSSNLGATPPPAGQLIRYDGPTGYTYVDGLNSPTSLDIDQTAMKLYITDRTDGEILTAPIVP